MNKNVDDLALSTCFIIFLCCKSIGTGIFFFEKNAFPINAGRK